MYRKFTSDYIFTGYEMLTGPAVLVTDEYGTIIEIINTRDAGEDIEIFSGMITPGFINAHCHLELSHLQSAIPPGTGLVEFVQRVMRGRAADPEFIQSAMVQAEAEMYSGGIAAVGDICNTADTITIKNNSKLQWHNFIEVSGFMDSAAQKRLDDMQKVYMQFRHVAGNQCTSFSPHAPYSVSRKLFQLLNKETSTQLITIHNQECAAEDELYLHKSGDFLNLYKNFGIDISSFEATGKPAFQSWLPYFTYLQSVISVHNTFITPGDLAYATNYKKNNLAEIFYCICINANKYIEQTIPPISLLMANNAALVIGTDSYASNRQLNILEEIKAIGEATEYAIPLQELLQWATINGARALQLSDRLGSFEKGKKPGIVLIEGLGAGLQTSPHSSAKRII